MVDGKLVGVLMRRQDDAVLDILKQTVGAGTVGRTMSVNDATIYACSEGHATRLRAHAVEEPRGAKKQKEWGAVRAEARTTRDR